MQTRKSIPKSVRDRVKQKCNNRCAYCGREVDKLCIDHVYPVTLEYIAHKFTIDVNDEKNLLPACFSCNNYKNVLPLEYFRQELQNQVQRARTMSVNFRLAENFQQITVNEHPIVFYFESIGVQTYPDPFSCSASDGLPFSQAIHMNQIV